MQFAYTGNYVSRHLSSIFTGILNTFFSFGRTFAVMYNPTISVMAAVVRFTDFCHSIHTKDV